MSPGVRKRPTSVLSCSTFDNGFAVGAVYDRPHPSISASSAVISEGCALWGWRFADRRYRGMILRVCSRHEAAGGSLKSRRNHMGDFVKVAKTEEIKPGQARRIDIRGKGIALFNIAGDYYAID